MKEITRIHLAKVAYDIELDAKKDIQAYITALERYADDAELLSDIEIRITELLAERGVTAGGVITKDDVAAVRAQLGEPSDFASEDVTMSGLKEEDEPRRVYRDEDNAMVGGVLAGFAKFFNTDVWWVRLIFIVLLFVSFGTALLVYAILWFIIPPARTAAERLRMHGRAVTLASIKELAGGEGRINERARIVRRVLSGIVGSLLILFAITGLLAVVAVVFGLQFSSWDKGFLPFTDGGVHETWWFTIMTGLFILSGLLFSVLCFVLASAAFRRQWSKRVSVAVIAIIVAGLVTFASGIGTGIYGQTSEQARIAALREIHSTNLPVNIMSAKNLVINSDDTLHSAISYQVGSKPYYTIDAMPGVKATVTLSEDGTSILVGLTGGSDRMNAWLAPTLTVYGPALNTIQFESDYANVSYYNEGEQKELSIDAKNSGSQFSLEGQYEKVTVLGDAYSMVALDNATINELFVDGGGVRAGVVKRLVVTQPDACPAHPGYQGGYAMTVRGISSGVLVYNGKEGPANTISNSCGKVVVGDESYLNEEW